MLTRKNSFPGLVIELLAVMSWKTVHVVPEMHNPNILDIFNLMVLSSILVMDFFRAGSWIDLTLKTASYSCPQRTFYVKNADNFKPAIFNSSLIHHVYQLCYFTNGSDYPFHNLCSIGQLMLIANKHRGTMQQIFVNCLCIVRMQQGVTMLIWATTYICDWVNWTLTTCQGICLLHVYIPAMHEMSRGMHFMDSALCIFI